MIFNNDCLDEMSKMESNSISCIVTDPPYGLSFMGKEWDNAVPLREYWIACWNVLKPGAFLLAFGGTRTFHRLACAIEDAGFELRDTLMWIYGSGFPKSHNRFGIEGYGTALKPAYEPIIMAMKPCDGTFANNAEKWGQAGINIDACRIEIEPADDIFAKNPHTKHRDKNSYSGGLSESNYQIPKGRWPANVLFDEEAAKMLDEQSGVSKAKSQREGVKGGSGFGYFDDDKTSSMKGIWPGDPGGGASRFFYCAKTSSKERNEGLEGMPEIEKPLMGEFKNNPGRETPKSSPTPRQNHHPTVKPLKLMRYLITLVMPPKDGVLLDPFAGSGSTIVAAHQLGLKAIGIEKSAEYCEIARKRLENVQIIPKEIDSQLSFLNEETPF